MINAIKMNDFQFKAVVTTMVFSSSYTVLEFNIGVILFKSNLYAVASVSIKILFILCGTIIKNEQDLKLLHTNIEIANNGKKEVNSLYRVICVLCLHGIVSNSN